MKGLLLTYVVALFGAVISLRKPVIGLFIYVGFSVLRPEAIWGWAGSMQDMSDIVAYPLLIGWAFQGFGSWSFGRGRSIVACIALFLVWSLLSTLQAIDPAVSWHGMTEFAKTLLPFLVGVTLIKTEKEARQLLWIIVLTQAYVAVDMNRTYLTGYNRAFVEGFGGMDNNSFGISLVTTLGAALGLFLSVERRWHKVMFGLATLAIMHTVMLTFSRGSFVGLLAVALMAFVVLPKRPKHLGAVVLAVLLGVYFTGPELAERLGTTFVPREMRDASAESRFTLWADMGTVIAEEPVFGLGPYNWPLVAERFGWPPGKEGHSLWIQTAAENGLPAVIFMLLFYGLTIVKLWPIARRRRKDIDESTAMLATGIILSIVGFCVSANFVSLRGLEPPVYITMIAVVFLKLRTVPAPVPGAVVAPKRPLALRPRTPLVRSS